MHPRAATLISQLSLSPHPEGGHYREIFRSRSHVLPGDDRERRPALTSIYFLLSKGEKSRWHQLRSDEVWHHYEGDPLELFWLNADERRGHRVEIGPAASGLHQVSVVPAGAWQAARSTGEYTLVGCTVGPGFDFTDFRLLADEPELARAIAGWFPEVDALL
jgi:predicted cupin superfamily sugar epimerase